MPQSVPYQYNVGMRRLAGVDPLTFEKFYRGRHIILNRRSRALKKANFMHLLAPVRTVLGG